MPDLRIRGRLKRHKRFFRRPLCKTTKRLRPQPRFFQKRHPRVGGDGLTARVSDGGTSTARSGCVRATGRCGCGGLGFRLRQRRRKRLCPAACWRWTPSATPRRFRFGCGSRRGRLKTDRRLRGRIGRCRLRAPARFCRVSGRAGGRGWRGRRPGRFRARRCRRGGFCACARRCR